MKTQAILVGAITVTLLATLGAVFAKPATPFTINWNQAQFQWRAASWGGPFGDWSSVYQNDWTTSDAPFTLTGNALHTAFTYDPPVSNVQGASTNYVYDKSSGLWIQHEGTISYNIPGYYCDDTSLAVCNGPYVNYWRGYLDFGENKPDAATFVHGVAYQWVYYYSSQDDSKVLANIPNAVWDQKMGAWLIGFSVYLWDKDTQQYGKLETVTVPANGWPTKTLSTTVLKSGVDYELKAYGTADAGDNIAFDAMCSYSYHNIQDGVWTDSVAGYESYGPQLLDLYVNGVDMSWGTACSTTNTYSMAISGDGNPVSFSIYDIYPINNAGYLSVDIFGKYIPFPTSFPEPVPANNYKPLGL